MYVDCEYHLMGVESHLWGRFHSVCIDCDGPVALEEEALVALRELAFDPERYGQRLFAHLFPQGSDLLAGFQETKVFLLAKEEGMRFRIYIAPSVLEEVRELAWERLHDGNGVLAFSSSVAFSRYLAVRAPLGNALPGRPRLLVAIAAPPDLPTLGQAPIDLEKTRSVLERCFQEQLDGCIEYEFFSGPVTPGDLLRRLQGGAFHALHLVAHGLPPQYQGAGLILQHPNGLANPVPEQGVANIFLGNPDLRLVTLIACHGGAAAVNDPFQGLAGRLVRGGVPAVIAMGREISFEAAELFSQHLYTGLAATGQVDVAVNAARRQLSLLPTDEWDVPILFMRLRDGRPWSLPRSTPRWIIVLIVVVLCLGAGAGLWKMMPSPVTSERQAVSEETEEPAGDPPSKQRQPPEPNLVKPGKNTSGASSAEVASVPESLEEKLNNARAYRNAGGRENLEKSAQIYEEILRGLAPKMRSLLNPSLRARAEERRKQGNTSEAAGLYEELFRGLERSGLKTNSPE